MTSYPALAGISPQTRRRIGMLTVAAIDQLWYGSPDAGPDNLDTADPDDYLGCCPVCCAPCRVLWELLQDGELDLWVRGWPERSSASWWDDGKQEVRRDFLDRAWGNVNKLGCEEQHV